MLAIGEPVEFGGRNKPRPRENVLLKIDQANQVKQARTFRDRVDGIVGEGHNAALTVEVSRALDLEPQRTERPNLRHDEVAVVNIRLDAGGKQMTVRTGQNLRLNHQLGEGSESGPLEHADSVCPSPYSVLVTSHARYRPPGYAPMTSRVRFQGPPSLCRQPVRLRHWLRPRPPQRLERVVHRDAAPPEVPEGKPVARGLGP